MIFHSTFACCNFIRIWIYIFIFAFMDLRIVVIFARYVYVYVQRAFKKFPTLPHIFETILNIHV